MRSIKKAYKIIKNFIRIRRNRTKERMGLILDRMEPLREAKKSTISFIAGIARNAKIFRIPLIVVLFLFIFVYNVIFHTLAHFKLREKLAKAVATAMTIVLTITSINVPIFAALGGDGDGIAIMEALDLEDAVASQTLHVGASESDIVFPDKIRVSIEDSSDSTPDPAGPTPDPAGPTPDPAGPTPDPAGPTPDPAGPTPDPEDPSSEEGVLSTSFTVIELEVNWVLNASHSSAAVFNGNAAGTYRYDPELPEGYYLDTDVELPYIEVTVIEDGDDGDDGEDGDDDEEDDEDLIDPQSDDADSATFANYGYPYGKNMSSSSVTLVIEVAEDDATYQWQVCSTKNGSYFDISGATQATYTFTPTANMWYRCVVNGLASKPVKLTTPSTMGRSFTGVRNSSQWYITNDTMAYWVDGASFDAVGLYNYNGQDYMIQTSYNKQWYMRTDASATPSVSSSTSPCNLDAVRVAFNDADDYVLLFEADLAAGQQAFGFGCDTQLASYSITTYSDSAALIGLFDGGNLQQVSMIGAASMEAAVDTDPAFVIAPITGGDITFWLGYYSSRQYFGFNTAGNVSSKVDYKGQSVRGKVEGEDSGMTMCWRNVPSGGKVQFRFGVGDVAHTGAISAKTIVTSNTITVADADPDVYYMLEKVNGDGTYSTSYVRLDAASGYYEVCDSSNPAKTVWVNPAVAGDIVFSGLEQNTGYRVVMLSKTDYQKMMAGDQTVEPSVTEDILTAIDPINPPKSEDDEDGYLIPEFTFTSTSIVGKNLDTSFSYNLQKENGSNVYSSFLPVNADGTIAFSNLQPGTDYYLVARSAHNMNSDRIKMTTYPTVSFHANGHGTAPQSIYNVVPGSTVAAPHMEHVTGFAFDGWFKEAACTNEWDFETDVVNANTVLYAKWTPHTHHWVITQSSTSEVRAYCDSNDTDTPCPYYGTSLSDCSHYLKVALATPNASYDNGGYAGENLVDTLTVVDSSSVSVSAVKYYSSSARDTAHLLGSAPTEVGTYYTEVTITVDGGSTYSIYSSFTISEKTLFSTALTIINEINVATGSEIAANYEVKDGNYTLVEGVDYDVDGSSDIAATEIGSYSITVVFKGNYTGTATKTWKITDATPPTANIEISGIAMNYDIFRNPDTITYDRFFNSSREITITAADAENSSSLLDISYYLASTGYTLNQVKHFADSRWISITDGAKITVSDNRHYVVYVKVADPSGNVTYINSQGFTIDTFAPSIRGIETNGAYCNDTSFRVFDGFTGVASVKIDDAEVYSEGMVDYALIGVDSSVTHKVEVTDKAGNTSTVTGIKLHVEANHHWKDPQVITQADCTHVGTSRTTCGTCGAYHDTDIPALGHEYDYLNDDNWSITWTYDASTETYSAIGYVACERGCGHHESFGSATASRSVTVAPTKDQEGVATYTAVITYTLPGGGTDTKTVTKDVTLQKLEDVKTYGDATSNSENELSTGIITTDNVPTILVGGFDTDVAYNTITLYNRTLLEDTDNYINTSIYLYLEIQNVLLNENAADRSQIEDMFSEMVGNTYNKSNTVFLDISLYCQRMNEEIDATGNVISTDTTTSQLNRTSSLVTINVDVNTLNFPAPVPGMRRTYLVERSHDYGDGNGLVSQIIYNAESVNGTIPITTDMFCTFAITYKDTLMWRAPVVSPKDKTTDSEDAEAPKDEKPKKVHPKDENASEEEDVTSTDDVVSEVATNDTPSEDDADSPVIGTVDGQEELQKTKDSCFVHFWMILIVVLGTVAAVLLRKKNIAFYIVLAAEVVASALLLIPGHCVLDYIFLVIVVIIAGVQWLLIRKTNTK